MTKNHVDILRRSCSGWGKRKESLFDGLCAEVYSRIGELNESLYMRLGRCFM